MDEWDFHRTLDVNLAGPFFLMQRVAQVMIKQGGGLMVVGGSPTGRGEPMCSPDKPTPTGGPAYLASQAALEALAQLAAEEFKAYNIEVKRIEDFRLLVED
jgi:NAD(P)-dependent dehydrogenase (short-subunit alcohol dehydrogenase family)